MSIRLVLPWMVARNLRRMGMRRLLLMTGVGGVAAASLLVHGCSEVPETTPTTVPTESPRVFQPAVSADVAVQTVVSGPISKVVPTRTPTAKELTSTEWQLLGLGPERQLPVALHPDAERLGRDQVASVWEEFLTGARVEFRWAAGGAVVAALCADKTGSFKVLEGNGEFEFTWTVQPDPGGRWNGAILVMTATHVIEGGTGIGHTQGVMRQSLESKQNGAYFGGDVVPNTVTELTECPV